MKSVLMAICSVLLFKCGGPTPSPTPGPGPGPTPAPSPTPPAPPQYKYSRGFIKPNKPGLHAGAPFKQADHVGELPPKWNWETMGYNIPVRNQGNAGTCWAHATEENFEWARNIFLGVEQQLSVQYMVGLDFSGTGGGDFDGSREVSDGLPTEADCPYQADNSECPKNVKIAAKALSYVNVGPADGSSPSVTDLKYALEQWGPLAIDVAAGSDFDSYRGPGVMTGGNFAGINHMIELVGWDDSLGSAGAWLTRNSWGTDWGINGDAWLEFGYDQVANDAATALVKAPNQKPTPGNKTLAP